MRVPDGVFVQPVIIIGGWITAIILVFILFRVNSEFETEELATYGTLGAYVFVLQLIRLPLQIILPVVPFLVTLSGIPLVIIITGVKRGLLIGSTATILNHILIPGAISNLGIILTNLIITGVIVGYLPSIFYQKMNRRIRYLTAFLTGLVYILVEGALLTIEYILTHELEAQYTYTIFGIFLYFLIVGLLEAFFTGLTASYYYKTTEIPGASESDSIDLYPTDDQQQEEEEEDEIEKIDFSQVRQEGDKW